MFAPKTTSSGRALKIGRGLAGAGGQGVRLAARFEGAVVVGVGLDEIVEHPVETVLDDLGAPGVVQKNGVAGEGGN